MPLIIACHKAHPLLAAACGLVSGLGTAYGTLHWVFEVPGFGLQHFLLASSLSGPLSRLLVRGPLIMSRARVTLGFPAAALWVLLDYVRAHAGFLAFPWGTLAHTQHRNLPLLQVATITGEYGVTFVVVLASVAVAGFMLRRAWRVAAFATLLFSLTHIGGFFALQVSSSGPTIRVAAVQPNIQRGEQATEAGRVATFERLERLTQAAAERHPSLIAWPETAIAGNLQANPLLAADLQSLAEEARTPIVMGVSEVEKFASRDATGNSRRRTYNSAYLVSPGKQLPHPIVNACWCRSVSMSPWKQWSPGRHGWAARD